MTAHEDLTWEQRHIRIMRLVVHECAVPGCVGSAPLVWVPTVADDQSARYVESIRHLIRDVPQVPGTSAQPARPDHVHWATGGGRD